MNLFLLGQGTVQFEVRTKDNAVLMVEDTRCSSAW